MKRRKHTVRSRTDSAPSDRFARAWATWQEFEKEFSRFCYVVGVRSIRCVKAVGRFTRNLWRPITQSWQRRVKQRLANRRHRIANEWRAVRADVSKVRQYVGGLETGRGWNRLRAWAVLPVLAVRRHQALWRTLRNVTAPILALLVLMVTVWCWKQANFVLVLEYDGKSFGYVADEATYTAAVAAVESMVIDADDSFSAQRSSRMFLKVDADAKVLDTQAVSELILQEVSGSLTETAGLYVDGRFVGALPRATLERLMTASLAKRPVKATETAKFFGTVEIVEGLYPVSAVSTEAEMSAYLDILPVQVSHFETYVERVGYETVVVWDENKLPGENVTTVHGKDGEQRVTVEVITINDKEQYRAVSSTEILVEPIDEVIVKGGSPEIEVGDGVATGKFVWPLPYTKVISSPFASRWGSFHGAIDISNGRVNGKPIIASDGGTVIEAGWHNSYGNYVLIDHGNGFKTRYAHCSSLNVTAGQQVAQGEYIANVGNTGYSFGAHLHFEIILNGQLVDPMDYVEY